VRRTLAEFMMPFAMLKNFRKSPLAQVRWEGVIWYSPSIFHGPLAKALKKSSECKGYLILRDIFPRWAADLGLMGRGLPYRFFDSIARYQYSVADVIGVQSEGNAAYFERSLNGPRRKLEVLHNWLGERGEVPSPVRLGDTILGGRKIFIYAGNMGVAQGLDILLQLAERFVGREDIGFLFIGRGSEVARLKNLSRKSNLNNVLFYDEIHPDEISDLYAQCSAGVVALDPRHRTHNIPGKFLTYLQSGLPVLANINAGNDIADLIRDERVGQVCESSNLDDLTDVVEKLLIQIECDVELPARCRRLFQRHFTAKKAVDQIISALAS
jgi:glycosyltransferase involved in cell wall biosynthesis